jgi:hypothetical protein
MPKRTYKIQDIYPLFQNDTVVADPHISEQLAKLKFFCGKATPKKDCCFSHLVGLPKHPHTLNEMKFMPHQEDLVKQACTDKHMKFHVNKSRQIGLTEIVLRIVQYLGFSKYAGGRVMIIAGTREKTTKKVMDRLKLLFQNIPETLYPNTNPMNLHMTNGTVFEGFPSNSDAIRGDTKIRAIVVDEAAHFNLTDDSVVMNAIEPIVLTNKSDLYLVSTPRGQRGFFYEIGIGENDFKKLQYDFTCALGWIYNKEEMEAELTRTDLDVDQEYRCQYTSSRSSIFGVINDESTEEYEAEEY